MLVRCVTCILRLKCEKQILVKLYGIFFLFQDFIYNEVFSSNDALNLPSSRPAKNPR